MTATTRSILCVLTGLAIQGCGYTVLKQAPPAQAPAEEVAAETVLPPGHPQIWSADDWIASSFIDYMVGEQEPLRFENMRSDPRVLVPSDHATLRLRISVGGPALADIWQMRVDQFGWVTMARWMQGSAGPEPDEGLATDRSEFRLDRASEAALRAMLLAVMPLASREAHTVPPIQLQNLPIEFWAHHDPGVIELDYRVERLDIANEDEWPGSHIRAPLDLMQVLIGTWDSEPPEEIRDLVRGTIASRPSLIDLALLIEGLVLAWEIEGERHGELEFPLQVGR